MSRKSGHRFSDEDMRQIKKRAVALRTPRNGQTSCGSPAPPSPLARNAAAPTSAADFRDAIEWTRAVNTSAQHWNWTNYRIAGAVWNNAKLRCFRTLPSAMEITTIVLAWLDTAVLHRLSSSRAAALVPIAPVKF